MYDVVVIGAGPAGSVVASRLAHEGELNVCLIERGGSSRNAWLSVPLGYAMTLRSKSLVRFYETEQNPGLNDRSELWPRGSLVGGSASVNAGVYVRPSKADLADWDEFCGSKFAESAKKHFSSIEGGQPRTYSLQLHNPENEHHSSCESFYQSCEEMGVRKKDDMHIPEVGCGAYWISAKDGKRVNAKSGYIDPVRRDLTVVTHTEVTHIQQSASGWDIYCVSGEKQAMLSSKRVILCAGALETPRILVRSGVGGPRTLNALGFPTVCSSKHVGRNLKDHLCVSFKLTSTEPTLNQVLSSRPQQARAAISYIREGKGLLATGINQAGAFFSGTDKELGFQAYFNPLSHTSSDVNGRVFFKPDRDLGVTVSFSHCRPTSIGDLRFEVGGRRPRMAIYPNFLSNAGDVKDWASLLEQIGPLFANLEKRGFHLSTSMRDVTASANSFLEHVRASAGTVYHPCGTCRMAKAVDEGVVGPDFKVFGLEGVYVCDASVLPDIPAANIQSAVFLMGEELADQLLRET